METLRDGIESWVRAAIADDRGGPGLVSEEVVAVNIMALFREAMLSDAALDSLSLLVMTPDESRAVDKDMMQGIFGMNTDHPTVKMDLRGPYRVAIGVVLDRVLGESNADK